MYLISRFLVMTKQTIEFPRMLVMMSIDVTVVMATSADMTEDAGVSHVRPG